MPGCVLEALTATWASKLALKHAYDRYPDLKQEAKDAYEAAGGEDTEKVDSQVTLNDTPYYMS